MLNKRGHVPTLMLFVVALALCIAAWFSFLTFSGEIGEQSTELQTFSDGVAFERTYTDRAVGFLVIGAAREAALGGTEGYEERFNNSLKERVELFGTFREVQGNATGLMRNGVYTLQKDGEEYVFRMPNVFIQQESGVNKVVQRFDIEVRFKRDGSNG